MDDVRSARPFRFPTSAGAMLVGSCWAVAEPGWCSPMGVAGTRIRPPVAGVVSLSGPGAFGAVSAWTAMPRLRVPVLFVAAADDQPFVGAARAMYRRARAADKRLLIVRRGHGSTTSYTVALLVGALIAGLILSIALISTARHRHR